MNTAMRFAVRSGGIRFNPSCRADENLKREGYVKMSDGYKTAFREFVSHNTMTVYVSAKDGTKSDEETVFGIRNDGCTWLRVVVDGKEIHGDNELDGPDEVQIVLHGNSEREQFIEALEFALGFFRSLEKDAWTGAVKAQ